MEQILKKKFKRQVFIVFAVVSFFVFLDVNKNGSFKDSKTGKFLISCGVYGYGEIVLSTFRAHCQREYRWAKQNLPVHLENTRQQFIPFLTTLKEIALSLVSQGWMNIKQLYYYLADIMTQIVNKWINPSAAYVNEKTLKWTEENRDMFTSLKESVCHTRAVLDMYRTQAVQVFQEVVLECSKHLPIYLEQARQIIVPFMISIKDSVINQAFMVWNILKYLFNYFVDIYPIFTEWESTR